MSLSKCFPLQPRCPGTPLWVGGSGPLKKSTIPRTSVFLFLLPSEDCSQWIISYTCTLIRNSFHTETVYKILLRAFFHKLIFLSEKWLPLNIPSQLRCAFAKDMNTYAFLLHYDWVFLSVDLYSASVLISELQRPWNVTIKESYLVHIFRTLGLWFSNISHI